MDTFGERTLCLLSPTISSITASTFLPGSTSRGSRSRTRMGTSMERNFYTYILSSLALVIVKLSPSASANPINVTISVNTPARMGVSVVDQAGNSIYRVNVQREKGVEIKCRAPVPNAQMTWFRIKDDKQEENMDEVCVGHDVELELKHKRKINQQHCTLTQSSSDEATSITLNIKRARKEGNEELKTIPDFRKYICKAMKEGNQDGRVTVDLVETIATERKFVRGERSVSVIEGNELEIYCDVHGVDKKEFESGEAKVEWHKDGQKIVVDELKNAKKIAEVGPADWGRPYRVGFSYEMAEPEHRGEYKCELIRLLAPDVDSNSTKVMFDYYVRVKDKLGALWPFLGICAEVVILCTIILIYEKRRNKQELEESDTDGSPDQ